MKIKPKEIWRAHKIFGSITVEVVRVNDKTVVIKKNTFSDNGAIGSAQQVLLKDIFLKNFKKSLTA
jgi:hypothetical protein